METLKSLLGETYIGKSGRETFHGKGYSVDIFMMRISSFVDSLQFIDVNTIEQPKIRASQLRAIVICMNSC